MRCILLCGVFFLRGGGGSGGHGRGSYPTTPFWIFKWEPVLKKASSGPCRLHLHYSWKDVGYSWLLLRNISCTHVHLGYSYITSNRCNNRDIQMWCYIYEYCGTIYRYQMQFLHFWKACKKSSYFVKILQLIAVPQAYQELFFKAWYQKMRYLLCFEPFTLCLNLWLNFHMQGKFLQNYVQTHCEKLLKWF